MKTAWGDLDVSDAHVHFFSYNFFRLLGLQKGGLPVEQVMRMLDWPLPPEDPAGLARLWASELDRNGVQRAALIASLPADIASVAAAVAAFPERFYGYFFLDPTAKNAAAVAEKAIVDEGMHGICLFPALHHYRLNDDRLTPLFELAESTPGTVVFVHCGVLTVGVRKKLGLATPIDLSLSNPVDLTHVAMRYPDARFVVPHFGAGYFREALMVADLCPNVYFDTSSSNGWVRYQAPALDLRGVFTRALEVAGYKRLLFGSDSSFYPRGWHRQIFEMQANLLAVIGVTRDQAAAIFGGNLHALLNQLV